MRQVRYFFLKEDLTVSSVSTIRAAGAPTKLGRITFFNLLTVRGFITGIN